MLQIYQIKAHNSVYKVRVWKDHNSPNETIQPMMKAQSLNTRKISQIINYYYWLVTLLSSQVNQPTLYIALCLTRD
jgi:hypothetical protein